MSTVPSRNTPSRSRTRPASPRNTASRSTRSTSPSLQSARQHQSRPCGRALALLRGRRYVLPTDIHDLAKDVLRHRLVLTYQALADGVTSDVILDAALRAVPQPRIELAQEMSA